MMADDRSGTPGLWAGTILALASAAAFAFSTVAAIAAFRAGSNPATLVAARFVLPALVLVIWLSAQGRPVSLPRRDGLIAIALGVVTAIYSWALLHAIGAIPLALAILIFYLFPLVAAVILGLLGWERLGWITIAAIVVAFAGLALALDPRTGQHGAAGLSLAFLAAVGLGVVVAVSGRVLRTSDSRPVTLYMAAVSAVLLIALCALQGDFVLPNTAAGWAGFVAAALFYAFAMIAFFVAVSMIGPLRTSLLCYAEPVISAALGVAVLGEPLTLTQIGGIALVIVALIGATALGHRRKPA